MKYHINRPLIIEDFKWSNRQDIIEFKISDKNRDIKFSTLTECESTRELIRHMVASSNLLSAFNVEEIEKGIDLVKMKEELDNLRNWLRFFTSNSTSVPELFEKLDVAYDEDVRKHVSKSVAEYFDKFDS